MSKDTLKFASALLFVFAVGVAAWAVDRHVHRDSPRSKPEEVIEWRSQVLGWISAALFRKSARRTGMLDADFCGNSRSAGAADRCVAFIARQGTGTECLRRAVKNLDTRCEGLSPFLFVYSISGNTTYFLSILATSLNIKHLATNAPWIAGACISRV